VPLASLEPELRLNVDVSQAISKFQNPLIVKLAVINVLHVSQVQLTVWAAEEHTEI